MTALSPEQAAHFEKLIGEYEQQREDAQNGLRETMKDLRDKLGALVAKEDLADEVAGFRLFVKRRWDAENHPEKADKAVTKSEIADAYEFQASQAQVYTTRAHGAGRAKLAPADTEADATPHDADGVIIEQSAPSTPVLATDVYGEGAEPASGLTSDISAEVERSTAEGGNPSPIIEQPAPSPDVTVMAVEEPCGGRGPELDRDASHPRMDTPLPGQQGASQDVAGNDKPGPQDPLPLQVHRTVEGKPLTPAIDPDDLGAITLARQTAIPDIPAQFRRAPVQGNC